MSESQPSSQERRGSSKETDTDLGKKALSEAGEAQLEHAQELVSETDDLLDEIDDVLEENAEDFVRAYVQKGGQ